MEKTAPIEKNTVLGRKRDVTRDADIIEAALNILAKVGFDTMTMDMVAAAAKAGKATLYRRWQSKAELVRDALIWMSQDSVDLEHRPDTGDLRNDLLALLKPYSNAHGERKFRVLSGLGSFSAENPKLSAEVTAAVFGRWTDVNRSLMKLAAKRGKIAADADIEMACQIIVSLTSTRRISQGKPFDKAYYAQLLNNILLPALQVKKK